MIFVAYEGFELIPNAIDEMENPQRNLHRALVDRHRRHHVIYVTVALAALGNLTPAQIEHDQEYVLAVAARPTMGQFGFVLIGLRRCCPPLRRSTPRCSAPRGLPW